jgi:hypothetical protein
MPNLITFRDDPDAMLVMSLEEYDEVSGIAIKAAIMEHDVVGRSPAVTSVRSAEEGLLVSLNTRGRVDLPLIARLYHAPEYQIIAELGDLLYQDPDTGEWQTADVYLSGNVRAKLAAAERAGTRYARNVEALKAVQPEDVLPGDIDANLGAPWIPESDIQHFAASLGVPPSALQIGHPARGPMGVDADSSATPPWPRPPTTARHALTAWALRASAEFKTPVSTTPGWTVRATHRQSGRHPRRPREAKQIKDQTARLRLPIRTHRAAGQAVQRYLQQLRLRSLMVRI